MREVWFTIHRLHSTRGTGVWCSYFEWSNCLHGVLSTISVRVVSGFTFLQFWMIKLLAWSTFFSLLQRIVSVFTYAGISNIMKLEVGTHSAGFCFNQSGSLIAQIESLHFSKGINYPWTFWCTWNIVIPEIHLHHIHCRTLWYWYTSSLNTFTLTFCLIIFLQCSKFDF